MQEKPQAAQNTLLGEVGAGVLIASFHCRLSCRTKSCNRDASKAPPDGLASGNMIPDQQTQTHRGEIQVYALFLSLTATQDSLKGIKRYSTQIAAKPGCGSSLVFSCCSTWPGTVWSIAGWIQPLLQPSSEVLFTMLGGFSTP